MAPKKKINVNKKSESTDIENRVLQEIDTDETKEDEAKKAPVNLEEKVKELEKEVEKNHDRLLRVSAEFENSKKRSAREIADFKKFANERFAKALLSVVDNLDRAIESSSKDDNSNCSVVEGVTMTRQEILKVFEQFGIKPLDAVGKAFDPVFHQAVHQEVSEDYPENTVLQEFQKGYMIHDRLLRPAMVVVSMAKVKNDNQNNDEPKTD